MPRSVNASNTSRSSDPMLERTVLRIRKGLAEDYADQLTVEAPLEIQVQWDCRSRTRREFVNVTMRTPGNDTELAVGFLFSESIVDNREAISHVESDPEEFNRICVTLNPGKRPNLHDDRAFYSNSSCGVCGKTNLNALDMERVPQVGGEGVRINLDSIDNMAARAVQAQSLFKQTGGIHASALFSNSGELIAVREDVGRHNAMDKLIGYLQLNNALPASDTILILSGRIGYELVQKAAMAGIPVVVAVGAASSLAVDVAERAGITLGGFLRGESLNIYTHPERINKP